MGELPELPARAGLWAAVVGSGFCILHFDIAKREVTSGREKWRGKQRQTDIGEVAGELTANGSLKLWVCPRSWRHLHFLPLSLVLFLEADPCPSHSRKVTASRHLGLSR